MEIFKKSMEEWGEDLDADMRIDKFGLDNECAQQTSIYSKWARLSAEAGRERDYRQKELDEISADLDNAIRKDPGKYGIADVKENAVKAVIQNDKRVMKLKTDVIEITAYASLFKGAVNACDQKKTMLRMLGDLWLGEYYSNVEIKKGEGDERLRERMKGRTAAKGRKLS